MKLLTFVPNKLLQPSLSKPGANNNIDTSSEMM